MIKISLSFVIALLMLFSWDILESSAGPETYYYEAIPMESKAGGQKEFIKIEFVASNNSLEYVSEIKSHKGIENIKINMGEGAKFISGTRDVFDFSGNRINNEKIWRDGNKAYLQMSLAKSKVQRNIKYDLYDDRMLAVDGSLLALFRYLRFNSANTQDIFMIDFSGASISVTAKQAGTENINVPAGTFECYRIEVIVNIPLIKPKITYWITKDKPYFLVKHIGKRGPFTPAYITSLVRY